MGYNYQKPRMGMIGAKTRKSFTKIHEVTSLSLSLSLKWAKYITTNNHLYSRYFGKLYRIFDILAKTTHKYERIVTIFYK